MLVAFALDWGIRALDSPAERWAAVRALKLDDDGLHTAKVLSGGVPMGNFEYENARKAQWSGKLGIDLG